MSANAEIATLDVAGTAPSRPSVGGRADLFNKKFLLEIIIYDLLWSALHVGTLAISLNACARGTAHWSLRPWRHLLHDNSKIMQLALRYGPEIGLSGKLSADASKLYAEIAAEKVRLGPLLENANSFSERARGGPASATWRRLAGEMKSILAEFEREAISRLGGVLAEDADTLGQFLHEALAGDLRRIKADGEITLPVLKQMRRSPRLKADGGCTVLVGDKWIAAELRDVGLNGLGIVCRHPLRENQSITVLLDDGRELAAKVANRNGDRVGLLLEAKLHRDDPLFHRPG
jgi:PilZ domain